MVTSAATVWINIRWLLQFLDCYIPRGSALCTIAVPVHLTQFPLPVLHPQIPLPFPVPILMHKIDSCVHVQ